MMYPINRMKAERVLAKNLLLALKNETLFPFRSTTFIPSATLPTPLGMLSKGNYL
jgi:hypothetical protein